MKTKSIVQIAEAVARRAHENQYRKDGHTPYITHPEAVAAQFDDPTLKAIAWLHDVLEDSNIGSMQLQREGIPSEVIVAVEAMTHNRDWDYFEYIMKVMRNPLAVQVKIRDIQHNIMCGQLSKEKSTLYSFALYVLSEGKIIF